MTSSINKIVENFLYLNFTAIVGVLDYESLAELHTQSNCNSSSIQYNLGEGFHGLLALTLEPSVLNTDSHSIRHAAQPWRNRRCPSKLYRSPTH